MPREEQDSYGAEWSFDSFVTGLFTHVFKVQLILLWF